MRKITAYSLVFILGFSVCVVLLRAYGGFTSGSEAKSRQDALAILNKPAQHAPIPDTALVKAAAKIEPAVVNIDTLVTGRARAVDFLGHPAVRPYAYQGKGSGVIITTNGYIVTNNHVVSGAKVIRVTMPSGKQFDGNIVGADADADIAVVKIDATDLPCATLGDSAALKVGEYVLAIGYPLGIGTTVTHGIVSATDRRDLEVGEGRKMKQAIQTDAPINHGNSGGALANLNGELIGINTAILSENEGGSIGIGFAIPIDSARDTIKRIISQGNQNPPPSNGPYIGIGYGPYSPDTVAQLGIPANAYGNVPQGQGALVSRVYPLSPAADAGLKQFDLILAVNGTPVTQSQDVKKIVDAHKIGETLTLDVARQDGSHVTLKLKLANKPEGLLK